jgi:uncharacterized membrane protein
MHKSITYYTNNAICNEVAFYRHMVIWAFFTSIIAYNIAEYRLYKAKFLTQKFNHKEKFITYESVIRHFN